MKDIYIFGTGGFAKEVYYLITEINKSNLTYNVAGFINVHSSENHLKIGSKSFPIFVEESFFSKAVDKNASFAIGIGNPKILKKLFDLYSSKYNFPNLIHPGVTGLFETIEMGSGNIVTGGCMLTVDIKIGSFNIFNLNTSIGHDSVIGSCNVINPGVNISGGIQLGNGNLIGTGSSILQYLKIGDYNTIGAGSTVRSSIESNQTVIGNPAVDGIKFGKLRNFINKL